MTPAEVGAYIAAHGGPAGGEGPDAQGIITQRAKDGSTLTIRQVSPDNLEEVSRSEAAPGQGAPGASAPAASGGDGRQQSILDQLKTIAPGGDPGKLEYLESTEPRKVTRVPPGAIDPVEMTVGMPVRTWYDPATGRAMKFDVGEDGSFTRTFSGVDATLRRQAQAAEGTPEWHTEGTPDPNAPGGYDNSRPIMVRTVNGQRETRQPGDKDLQDWNLAQQRARNPGGLTDAEVQARQPERKSTPVEGRPGIFQVSTLNPTTKQTETHYEDAQGQTVPTPAGASQIVPGTTGATSQSTGIWNPSTNDITWVDNPNAVAPTDQRFIFRRNPSGGAPIREPNPNYIKPSKIDFDKQTGKMVNYTVDDNGEPIVLPVNDQTKIKPAELPVLQAQYGQIASGLGSLLADLNKQVAAGTITPQERDQAFTAAHQQADTQVSEINSILSNSRATWAQDISQQNQTFGEAASRRNFASGLVQHAFTTGANLAESSGPGHGQAIAQGMAAMLDIGQKYAAGMGGFPSMAPVAVPRAVQQARDIGLPGFGDAAGGPPAPTAAAASASTPTAAPPMSPEEYQRQLALARKTEVNPPSAPGGAPPAFTPTPYPGLSPAAVQATTGTSGALIQGALGAGATPTPGEPGGPPLQTTYPPYQPPPPPVSGPTSRTDDTYPGMVQQVYRGQPANPQTMPFTGQNPGMQLMSSLGNRFGTTTSPIGLPAAVGGSGYFDLGQVAQGMLGDGSDPAWAEAVRQAYAAINAPRQPPGVMV